MLAVLARAAYKPDLALFRHAHAVLGVTPAETIHVAASQPLDMAVCKPMGICAFWVNRRAEAARLIVGCSWG